MTAPDVTGPAGTVDAVRRALSAVTDPEIPVLTLEDLGVLRGVDVEGGRVVVTVTPTYSGCPAMDEIRADIRATLAARGWDDVEVRTVLRPAWSTDDLSERGRRRLREYGIAPPGPRRVGPVPVALGRPPGEAVGPAPVECPPVACPPVECPPVECPQCGSADTEELSRFSSTSCKALWRCRSCREPFERFKAH